MQRLTAAALHPERLLEGFELDFDFLAPPPLPEEEFVLRLVNIRKAAAAAGLDALVVHTDLVGWFHTSNAYLRYICDWMREGVLIIPIDSQKPLILLSFFTQAVLLPPGGEPMLVEEIWQIGAIGHDYADRPGNSIAKTAQACASRLSDLGLARGLVGRVGDRTSAEFFSTLKVLMPKASLVSGENIVDDLQRIRSPHEIGLFRAAAQLASIATQAAYHVTRPGVTDTEIYAAFTYAQMARGGETGDGYQIGINPFGTHCGKPYGHVVRSGDLVNLYISNVTYRGYSAQTARMIAVGSITSKQEDVLAMCAEGVKRAAGLLRPGVLISAINNAAFGPFLERGLLGSTATVTMPYNWSPADDGGPRRIVQRYVPDPDLEAQGRTLNHIYPATIGPHNPNLGHSVGMAGARDAFHIASHNSDRLEAGMVIVLHSQWLDPLSAGCNVGDLYVVTSEGAENLSRHTPLEAHRVPA